MDMKHKSIFLILTVAALFVMSCKEQLNYTESVIYDKEYIQQAFNNVGGFMTNAYSQLEYDYGNYSSGAMLASATDESEYSVRGNDIEDFYNGGWSASNPKATTWNAMYKGISTCNLVLSEMQGLTFDELFLNKDYQQQMYRYNNYQYDARFMRAFFYFFLVRQYGDIPMPKPGMSIAEINSLSRTPSDEVFQFIISECNEIKDKIIKNHSDLGDYALSEAETGRADQLTVLALRAQAALYYASPLFNPNGDKTRWHTAATYYKELVAACDARGKKLTPKYADTWSYLNYSTPAIVQEILFARRTSSNNNAESYNYPAGIEKAASMTDVDNIVGANCPTQNLVDAFDMADGTPIAESADYDPQNPYVNRDPRLELTVAINGKQWPTYTGAPTMQTYVGGANGQPLLGATTTGYYLKKLLNGTIDLRSTSRYSKSYHTFVLYRMGGIYLDYAEAVFNWLGGADVTDAEFAESARALASRTRVRAGMPELPEGLSKEAFWTRYKNERMVELAFENHRFWDVRRWKEADKYFKNIVEMEITKDGNNLTYTRKTVTRLWDDKMYLFPIPQAERLKNPNLSQNPGW